MKPYIAILAIFVLCLQIGGAQMLYTDGKSIGTYKTISDLSLIQVCNTDSAFCDSCNISSISYPNGSVFVSNSEMTKRISDFNYTINGTLLTENGNNYQVVGFCLAGSNISSFYFSFNINQVGLEQSTAQGLGSLAFLALYCVLTIVFGIVGFKLTETKYLWVLGIFVMFLSTLFLIYDVWLGYEYHSAITGFSNSNVPEFMFYGILAIVVCGLLVSGILLFTYWEKLVSYIKKEFKTKENDPTDELENV